MKENVKYKVFTGDVTNEEAVEAYKAEIDMQVAQFKEGLLSSRELSLFVRGLNFAWISVNVDFFDKYLEPYWRGIRYEIYGY